MSDKQYTISELAEASGTTPRTIHLYISRGILPSARAKGGRGSHYDESHLTRLAEIKRWQAEGRTLAQIEEQVNPPSPSTLPVPPDGPWFEYRLTQNVVVSVRNTTGWRSGHLMVALENFRQALKRMGG